jgi:hypothetical protein
MCKNPKNEPRLTRSDADQSAQAIIYNTTFVEKLRNFTKNLLFIYGNPRNFHLLPPNARKLMIRSGSSNKTTDYAKNGTRFDRALYAKNRKTKAFDCFSRRLGMLRFDLADQAAETTKQKAPAYDIRSRFSKGRCPAFLIKSGFRLHS